MAASFTAHEVDSSGIDFDEGPAEAPDDSPNCSQELSEREHGHPESLVSVYGAPVSPELAAEQCPAGSGGLIWHAELVTSDWRGDKDCDAEGRIKPRRPTLPVLHEDFFSSLVRTADGRWLFSGVLNGWPGLTCLELRSITCRVKSKSTGMFVIERAWDADRDGAAQVAPAFPIGPKSVRATLRSPAFTLGGSGTLAGWSAASPGCAWWFFAELRPRFAYGEGMLRAVHAASAGGAVAVRAHHFVHRYARGAKKESTKERNLYHGAVLLEWDHGRYCTVVELATRNGVGGRYGRSNWCEDKMEPLPELYRCMAPEMIQPWQGKYAEIRCVDVAAKSLAEFRLFLEKHEGHGGRFVDATLVQSEAVRLSCASQADLMRGLLNYIGRELRYAEEWRNCQTFAADFFGFLCGKSGIVPFHKVNRVAYKPRPYLFLYRPDMYKAGGVAAES